MSAASYLYHRARALYEANAGPLTFTIGINPNVPTAGIMPIQTGILPRHRGGAGAVSIHPTTPAQTARLQRYLYTKSKQQYEGTWAREAEKYGLNPEFRLTSAAVDGALQSRATWAADKITQTTLNQLADGKAAGVAKADVLAARAAYKPEQIWQHEMGLAQYRAMKDFHATHPDLGATAHVEPVDAAEPVCEDLVALGSVPVASIVDELPAHPNCPHLWITDAPAQAAGSSEPPEEPPAPAPVVDGPTLASWMDSHESAVNQRVSAYLDDGDAAAIDWTDNADVSSPAHAPEDVVAYLEALARTMGVTITDDPALTGAWGAARARTGTTRLRPDMTPSFRAETLAHEIAHHVDYRLRWPGDRTAWDRGDAHAYAIGEIRAETVSHLLMRAFGFGTETHARGYVARYAIQARNKRTVMAAQRQDILRILRAMLTGDVPPDYNSWTTK